MTKFLFDKDNLKKFYNFIICILALISVVFAIIDITKGLPTIFIIADKIIYAFFVLDYFIRLFLAFDKLNFIKNNILDFIAIMPFNSAFRVFRVLKIAKLARLSKAAKVTKFFRIGSFSARLITKIKRFLNTNGFKYVVLLSGFCILIGAFGIMYFENMKFSDALWWSFVTATTVGYGDLSPVTNAGRIIAALLMLVGIGLIGSLTSSITTYFITPKNENEIDNDKITMVLLLYNSLNEEEKKQFKRTINDS